MSQMNLVNLDFASARDELITRHGVVNVIFDNGEIVAMKSRVLLFHLIFWGIGRKWGVMITPELIVDTSVVNSSTISKLGSLILDRAQSLHHNHHDIVFDFNEAINTINNLTINHCQEYHRSLNILDLARIAVLPQIRAICDDKVTDPKMPMVEAEAKLKENKAKLFAELNKPHPMNKLYYFTNLRFVKETQLAHIFYQIGFRTDINDTIIRYTVVGNYLDGLQNYKEYALEALSAKKSAFYTKDSIPDAEYFSRCQHLLLNNIKYLYPGDCGTTIVNPMLITKKLRNAVLYKNIVEGSRIITIDQTNVDSYIGKVVKFRTPIGCQHGNGVCEICAGKLLSNITPGMHLGIYSAMQVTEKITQVILSSKHMQDTTAVEYTVPDELTELMFKKQSGIYIKPKLLAKFKNITLIIGIEDASYLRSIRDFDLSRLSSISESAFGRVSSIVMMKDGLPVIDQVNMIVNNQKPLYSKQLIKYIGDQPESVVIRDGMFSINLNNFNFEDPLFKIIAINNSMVKFVKAAKYMLETDIANYTSASALIADFADLIYDQVHPNLSYIEVVLRASMITNRYDLRMPVVTDIDNVKFSKNHHIVSHRSLGTLCAFQGLPATLTSPVFWISPKVKSDFCSFLNLRDNKCNGY